MNTKLWIVAMTVVAGISPWATQTASGQTLSSYVQENFSGASTTNQWYFFNGACLTAGSTAWSLAATFPGTGPACVGDPYYNGVTLVGGNSGNLNTTPDSANPASPNFPGALRLTNDSNSESGAIISAFTFPLASTGLSVSFSTETYQGDSGGGNSDGADGISFFLQDAGTTTGSVTTLNGVTVSSTPTLGDWGGSLGYTCSNANNSGSQGYDGMVGAYLAVGIDEYGNFLNAGDNSSSGYGYVPNRIGLRGAGATAWSYLVAAYPQYYGNIPTAPIPGGYSQSTAVSNAVHLACSTGYVYDYSANVNAPTRTAITLPNYGPIPNAYKVLATKIANEGATLRGYGGPITATYGIPITYNLTITTAGLLSMSYSYNGGAFQSVISGQQITTGNSAIPALVRFGFAGSTGGSRNNHEIMCFQAIPQTAASSSAGLNQKQTAKVQTGTQVYFAFYNPNNWTGDLTSQNLDTPVGDPNPNDLQIDPIVNWDASCVLTGVPTGQTCSKTGAGPSAPQASRQILTWNGASGVPFEWGSLTTAQQNLLDAEDVAYGSPVTAWRLNYLRGSRADEQNALGVDPGNATPPLPGGLRARTSVLGDIIDSSPTWVGPPNTSYPNVWKDLLYPAQAVPENVGTNTYANFATAGAPATNNEQQRLNVVYSGSNDGLLHGFESGSFDPANNYVGTFNDGKEVIAYMPGYTASTIDDAFTTTGVAPTQTFATNTGSDFSSVQYGHRFSVDAPPGTGDLFYNGAWHTWLVGGMGPGGKAMYALDISDPGQFSEGNASSLVMGEWSVLTTTTPTTTGSPPTTTITALTQTVTNSLPCPGDAAPPYGPGQCAYNLGMTYGVPQIRRLHNGQWAAIFGNGSKSSSGDAGIFVMLVSGTGTVSFRYLSTGWAASGRTNNGIYYVTPVDLDGDHITDYVYAGDLQGNVWRFDLTGSTPGSWAVAPHLIFTTAGGSQQPITTKVAVASVSAGAAPRVLVEFGTGQQTAFTNSTAAAYASAQQALYGVWDWNMGSWNSLANATVKYDSLSSGPILSGTGQLQAQTILGSYTSTGAACGGASGPYNCTDSLRTVSNTTVCWADIVATCANPTAQYGWYLNLDFGNANPNDPNDLGAPYPANPTVDEQVIFNPTLQDGAFIVNTTIPPTNSLRACASTSAGGWTIAINPATGGSFTNSFFGDANHNFTNIGNQIVSGIALSGTGSVSVVTKGTATYAVTQTVSGTGAITAINPPGGTQGSRITWIEKR
jgi:type IV pilus assembly protein PilY1